MEGCAVGGWRSGPAGLEVGGKIRGQMTDDSKDKAHGSRLKSSKALKVVGFC